MHRLLTPARTFLFLSVPLFLVLIYLFFVLDGTAGQLRGSRIDEFEPYLLRVFFAAGCGGFCLVTLLTFLAQRWLFRPLSSLTDQLNGAGGTAREMPKQVTAGKALHELVLLAEAYNSAVRSDERDRSELQEALEAAQIASRLKDEFLINMSHELRTPLNGVLGMINLMLFTTLDSEQHEFAETIQNSAECLLNLIRDVLNFSQLKRGSARLELAPFNIQRIAEEAAEAIRSRAQEKGLVVEVQRIPGGSESLIGDATRIRQVLDQLCDNAVKFTDSGRICLRVACRDQSTLSRVKITVADTGIGIAEGERQLIFGEFTQADGSLTRQRGGTGLGLAIVKELVTLMQGEIELESHSGKGSAFSVTLKLPVAQTTEKTDRVLANVEA